VLHSSPRLGSGGGHACEALPGRRGGRTAEGRATPADTAPVPMLDETVAADGGGGPRRLVGSVPPDRRQGAGLPAMTSQSVGRPRPLSRRDGNRRRPADFRRDGVVEPGRHHVFPPLLYRPVQGGAASPSVRSRAA
jgi:hypothetical protein